MEEDWESSNSASQLALFISQKQEVWEIRRRQIPRPAKGEVLVKIRATGLNHFDWMVHKKGSFVKNYPAIVGLEAAGEVEQVGEGVVNFVKGDRVCHTGSFLTNNRATFQFYTLVPSKFLTKIPYTMSYDEAATIPLCYSAAAFGLYSSKPGCGLGLTPCWKPEGRNKYSGCAMVVIGGASNVGKYVIQLARESGFRPIVAVAGMTHVGMLKGLGATHVLDRACTTGDLVRRVHQIVLEGRGGGGSRSAASGYSHPSSSTSSSSTATSTTASSTSTQPGPPLLLADIVFDAISSPETQRLAVHLTTPKVGAIVYTLPPSSEELLTRIAGERIRVVTPYAFPEFQPDFAEGVFGGLSAFLRSGVVRPNRHRTIPGGITAIPHGLQMLEARKFGGYKLVINP